MRATMHSEILYKRTVYIASALANAKRVNEIKDIFEQLGIRVSYDWTIRGRIDADNHAELAEVGQLEEQGVRDCSLFFMVHPAKMGSHCELGMARVLNKHIIILEEVPPIECKTFYYRQQGHQRPIHRFTDVQEAVAHAIKLLTEM